MPRNLLTSAQVSAAAVPNGAKLAKLNDGDGLFLLVARVKQGPGRPGRNAPKTTKRWRFAYRFGGRQNMLSLGDFPTVTLALARGKAEDARKQLADGIDPSAHRKAQKHASAQTFDALADEWLAKQCAIEGDNKRSAVTLDKLTWLLSLVRADIGALPVGGITPMQCLAALKRIEARGRYDTARRCRSTMSRVFKLAVATGRAPSDPTMALVGDDVLTPPPANNRSAIVEPTAFGKLLSDIEGYHGTPETRLALKLLALVALRPGELRQMRWSWVRENAGHPAICIPAGVMKMRREHRVPLSVQAVAALDELRRLTGWTASGERNAADADFIFPCSQPRRTVSKDGQPVKRPAMRPMSEGALGSALKRLGYKSTEHVPHGFRSSFSTVANEAAIVEPHVIEAALAHVIPGVAGDYNRATYWPQRVLLAQWWADRCAELREGRSSKVVALRPVVA